MSGISLGFSWKPERGWSAIVPEVVASILAGSHWTYHRWGCYHRACSGPGCHFMNLAFSAAVHDRGNEMQLPFPHWIRMKRAS